MKQFLAHCSSGKNAATVNEGSPLDFISYHVKGRPEVVEGHVRMGIAKQMRDFVEGARIVRSFPKFQNLPIVLSESDPEGCAACSARVYPPNAYRNGTLYPAYVATAMKTMLQLANANRVNLEGILTWAFEFEGQPYFDGFRTLATNGIDKPVLNGFRMAGLLRGERVEAESSGAVSADTLLREGVRDKSDVDAIAVRSDHGVAVMIWNYRDDDATEPGKEINLEVNGLPPAAKRTLLKQYRIDHDHSNSYTAWTQMGSPQNPSPAQYQKLEEAGQLQMLGSPEWIDTTGGVAKLSFELPLQGLSLVELTW